MNTLVTTNAIHSSETTDGSEHGPEASSDVTRPVLHHFKSSLPPTIGGQGIISGEAGLSKTDECTYETQEPDETYETDEIGEAQEAEESQEPEEKEEKEELATLGPKLSMAIDEAISKCRVSANRDINRPLFILAHKVRSIEEELKVRFSIDITAEVVHRWQALNHDHLEDDHDYVTEFLDKLSLVRYPKGRALAMAVEIARGLVPAKKTAFLSADVQLLASLCSVLQRWAGKKPFFLDGRSAATALGRPHETIASWLRALCRLGVIRLISKGRRGMASRYEYIEQRGSKHKDKHKSQTLVADAERVATN
jgi:hypothetical protein